MDEERAAKKALSFMAMPLPLGSGGTLGAENEEKKAEGLPRRGGGGGMSSTMDAINRIQQDLFRQADKEAVETAKATKETAEATKGIVPLLDKIEKKVGGGAT